MVASVNLSNYSLIGRYDLPEPKRTIAPSNSLLAQEVSAVTYNWDTDTLFVVGDGGTSIVQVTKTGQLIDSMTLAPGSSPQGTDFYDPEGLTYVGGGRFVMVEERYRQVNLLTYVPNTTLTRSGAQTVKLGTTIGNIGIEGISYDPQTFGFIAVKEIQPEGILQTSIDFAGGTASNGSPTTVNSTNLFDPTLANLADFADIYALSNLESLNGQPDSSHLLILSQESGKIINIDRSGNIFSSLAIASSPGNPLSVADQQHEGLTVDKDGFLYVTSENGGGDVDHPQIWVYAPNSFNLVNQAPLAVSLANTITSLAEGISTITPVKVANIIISDDVLGTNTLSLGGADAGSFEITGNGLHLKAGTILDYETKTNYSVTVNIDDTTLGSTPDVTTTYNLAVTNVNEVPPVPGSVVITEVSPWSSGNSVYTADWFELTNTGTNAVDISGWKIDDNSNLFANAVALRGLTIIPAGKSAVFLEGIADASTDGTIISNFSNSWFGSTTLPSGLLIGTYGGSGVGLSTGGDAVNLFDASGNRITGVSFGASTASSYFTFDNSSGLGSTTLPLPTVSTLSAVGVNKAFLSVNNALNGINKETGSPGVAAAIFNFSAGNYSVIEGNIEGFSTKATVRVNRQGDLTNTDTVQLKFTDGTAKGIAPAPIQGTVQGISTGSTPYILPIASGVSVKSILTTDNTGVNPDDTVPKVGGGSYGMDGIPDGLGAFDNGDGTFTLLMNHELGNTSGVIRDHGAKGAYVSKFIIDKNTLAVVSGEDLIKQVFGWNSATQSVDTSAPITVAFNRFCSADLASVSAYYNPSTGLGTQARIFMDGEEGGATGYQVATVVTGAEAGNTYILGKFNLSTNGSGLTGVGGWENALANPFAQDKTIVIGNNDGGTGIMSNSLAVYVGTKTNTGTEIDKAGLTNGTLKFVNVTGNPLEIVNSTTRATNITDGTRFTLNGTASTTFSRPEDGAWNPLNPSQYFFVTTDRLDQVSDGLGTQIGQTRLWRLTFDDITNPDAGGKIDLLVDGDRVNGVKVNMFDNITIDKYGHILLQEDVGGAAHNGKIWQYDIPTDSLKLLTKHDPSRFGDVGLAATLPFTNDEETSGIIDAQDILGPGWFLTSDQAHYTTGITTSQVEGGQLLALFNPDTYNAYQGDYNNSPINVTFAPGEAFKDVQIPIAGDTNVEGSETVNLTLANPSVGSIVGALQSNALLTIQSDPAIISGTATANVKEGTSVNVNGKLTTSGSLTVTDEDPGENKFKTTVVSASGNLGSLTITDTGSFTYTVDNSAVEYLGAAQTKVDTFTVSSFDGSASQDIAVTINGVTVAYSGVAAGDATSNSAILWTRTFDSVSKQGITENVTLQLATDSGFTNIVQGINGVTRDANHDYTLKIDATGLQSGTKYYYRFQTATGEVSSVGTFKTAPEATAQTAVRFAFSGDADGLMRPYPSTENFPNLNLDFFMFLGDTIYETASTGSPAATTNIVGNPSQALIDYHRKYLENLQPVNSGGFSSLQTLYASQGNYTAIDNHELGNRQLINGGAPEALATDPATLTLSGSNNPAYAVNTTGTFINDTTGFKTLVQAYSDYQPIREKIISAPGDARTDGTQQLYFAQQWGQNVVYVNTDTRSYRDARLKSTGNTDNTGDLADTANRTLLGTTQLAWLKQTLLAAQNNGTTWKFISVSDPIDQIGAIPTGVGLGADGGKSWIGGYRAERNDLLKFIADKGIKNVVFLATDDHQNRINELTYNDNGVVKLLPNALSIVDGPLGATGPDAVTNHSFSNIKSLADSLAATQIATGVNPIGLDPNFPGLKNVVREGDPNANTLRQPVDFYSPDTFNYTVFDISADGKTLNVNVQGINSYAQNSFPEPNPANPVRSILSFSLDAAPAVASDFNFDSKRDLLLRNSTTGEVGYWYMDNTNQLGAVGISTVPLDWKLVGTGDFNQDSKNDLLWQNSNTGEIGYWYMNNTTQLGFVGISTVPLDWKLVGTGDFNQDGKDDLLLRNSTTGEVGYWYMDNTNQLGAVGISTVPLDWKLVGTGDFNQDGKDDLLWQNSNTGEVGYWYMNNTTQLGFAIVGTAPSGWKLVGTGDFNQDSKVDLLWQNSNTGEVGYWYMDNTTQLGSAIALATPTGWNAL